MTREDLLAQLQDIRPPLEPAWWLPAPGQQALGLLLLAGLAILIIWLLRRRANRLLIQARRELRRIEIEHAGTPDAAGLAVELAAWLKRVALQAFPEQRLESVTGDAWLEFLDRGVHGQRFSRGAGRVFGADIYRSRPGSGAAGCDGAELLALCERWLTGIAPRLRSGNR